MSVKALKSERALKEAAQVQQFSKYMYHSLTLDKRTCHKVLPQLGALPFLDLDISGGKARELSLSSGYIAHYMYTVRKYTHNTHVI